MSSSPTLYNGEPCAGIHYLCIMTASPSSSNMQKYMYPRRRIRKTSFHAPSFDTSGTLVPQITALDGGRKDRFPLHLSNCLYIIIMYL